MQSCMEKIIIIFEWYDIFAIYCSSLYSSMSYSFGKESCTLTTISRRFVHLISSVIFSDGTHAHRWVFGKGSALRLCDENGSPYKHMDDSQRRNLYCPTKKPCSHGAILRVKQECGVWFYLGWDYYGLRCVMFCVLLSYMSVLWICSMLSSSSSFWSGTKRYSDT